MLDNIYLAATTGSGSSSSFWDSGLGGFLSNILVAVGVLVVLISILKAAGKFMGGNISKGIMAIAGGAIVAAFCFQPQLIDQIITLVSDVIALIFSSTEEVGKGN